MTKLKGQKGKTWKNVKIKFGQNDEVFRLYPGTTTLEFEGRWILERQPGHLCSWCFQTRTYSILKVEGRSASFGMPNHSGMVSLSKIRKSG